MEELETLSILLPNDKFTLQWIDLASNVEVLNIHNNTFDEPRKITKKERTQKIDTKNSKKDLLLVKMISNNSQRFGMRREPLFIDEASTSFSFFINSFR
jgi:hypothetical protein